jgi:phosphopantetheinyl transferase (holo-ACP synthase)
MPLYKEWAIGDHGLAAIWLIEEPEAFFVTETGIHSAIRNEKRRTEHLAGRYLLQHLKEDFPILHIDKDEHDKPRIQNNEYYFSISHSWPYVAAVIDPRKEAGIDIQVWHPRITLIQHKFLSPREQGFFKDDVRLLTAAWSAKEAAYKWYGRRGVDFIADLPIQQCYGELGFTNMDIYVNFEEPYRIATVENIITTDFACSYVISDALPLGS